MASGLLDELSSMNQDQGLCRLGGWLGHSTDEVAEDNSLAATRSERDAQSLVTERQMFQDGLDTFFLIIPQGNFWGWHDILQCLWPQ